MYFLYTNLGKDLSKELLFYILYLKTRQERTHNEFEY